MNREAVRILYFLLAFPVTNHLYSRGSCHRDDAWKVLSLGTYSCQKFKNKKGGLS